MRMNHIRFIALIVVYISFAEVAVSDFINFTGAELSPNVAEFYIEDDRLLLVLEIGERHKEAFSDLISNSGNQNKLERFFEDGLVILADGKPLKGRVVVSEVRERVKRPSAYKKPPGGEMPSAYVTYVEIEYPFVRKPATIELVPPLNDRGYPAASIGYVVYHKAIPVIDFRFLVPGAILNLDWEDPWYSKFDNPNLKRHHSSSLMSFLYVEPFEVRHEILVRLKDLESWLDLGYEDADMLVAEQKKAIEKILSEFIIERNKVEIDESIVKPTIDRVQFVKPNLMGIQYLEDTEEVEYLSAIVGIIISYPVAGMPQKVTVDWDMFSDKIQNIPARMTDPAGPYPYNLSPDDNVLIWNNYLKNYSLPNIAGVNIDETTRKIDIPIGTLFSFFIIIVIAWQIRVDSKREKQSRIKYIILIVVLLAGIALYPFFRVSLTKHLPSKIVVGEKQSEFIIENLLKNVYRSFDFKSEDDIYDRLALSLDGDLLRDVYLQTREGMELESQGGVRARVKDVEIVETYSESLPNEIGFKFHTIWNVSGSVEHWGHKHNRINQYEAEILVKPIEDSWKITNIDLIEEKRVQSL